MDAKARLAKNMKSSSLPFRLSSYKLTSDVLRNVEVSTRFKSKEIRKLHQQFTAIADKNGKLGQDGFRQSMGILGMVQDSILCQRLFSVFNESKSGYITFEEFAKGLGVLVKGSVDEKLTFAFAMTDIDGSGEITPEELEITVDSIMRIYAGIMGSVSTASLDRAKIRKMFNQLDRNHDGYITLEEYKRGMRQHPEFVASLRGQDLFSIGQESALKVERSRIRKYKRVANSMYKDAVECIALLEAIRESTSQLDFKSDIAAHESDNAARPSADLDDVPDDSSESSDDTILSDDWETSYESESEPEDFMPQKTCTISDLKTTEKLARLKKELLPEDLNSDEQLYNNGNRKPQLRISLSEFTHSVEGSQPGGRELESLEEKLLSLLYTIKAKAFMVIEEGKQSNPDASSVQKRSGLRPGATGESSGHVPRPHSPLGTSFISDPTAALCSRNGGVEFAAESDFSMDSILNSPVNESRPWDFGGGDRKDGGDGKDDDGVLGRYLTSASKGSTVFFGHRNWDLVINVMKGIQMAVGRSAAEASRSLNVFDFNIKEKYTLVAGAKVQRHHHRGGVGLKDIDSDRSGRSCRFVDYAPVVFAKLREHFGIKNEAYVHSIGPGNMLSNLMLGSLSSLAELGSEGKSGSFFYFTSDGRFMVKTVHKEEHKLLRSILPQYYYHMTASPDSLLCRIVGCHVLRLSKNSKIGANKIYFVVMQNVLNTDLDLDARFDLKGSWVGRKSNEEARRNPKSTLKDVDLQDMGQFINLGPERRETLLATIRRDAKFLEEKHIIDYSLLLGIHREKHILHTESSGMASTTSDSASGNPRIQKTLSQSTSSSFCKDEEPEPQVPFFQQDNGGMLSIDEKETYVMGVIDFLTLYSSKKVAERLGKSCFFDKDGISVQTPQKYAKRFVEFFEKIIK